jgi:hypothetical protein
MSNNRGKCPLCQAPVRIQVPGLRSGGEKYPLATFRYEYDDGQSEQHITEEEQQLYDKAVRRLKARGIYSPAVMIANLEKEIDYYRTRIRNLMDYAKQKDPATRTGSWVWGVLGGHEGIYCSLCGAGWPDHATVELLAAAHKYCPECGAKMSFGKKEDETDEPRSQSTT